MTYGEFSPIPSKRAVCGREHITPQGTSCKSRSHREIGSRSGTAPAEIPKMKCGGQYKPVTASAIWGMRSPTYVKLSPHFWHTDPGCAKWVGVLVVVLCGHRPDCNV